MSDTPECECPECGGPKPNECGGYYCCEEHGHIDCDLAKLERALKAAGEDIRKLKEARKVTAEQLNQPFTI